MKLSREEKKLFDAISSLTQQQLKLFNDFDVRIATLLAHKEKIRKIIHNINKVIELATALKERYEKKDYEALQTTTKDTRRLLGDVEDQILKRFDNLFVDDDDRNELRWNLEQEEKDLLSAKRVKLHDFEELSRAARSSQLDRADEAKKKLRDVLDSIRDAIKYEEYAQSVDKHFEHLVSRLEQVTLDQKEVVKKELSVLRQIEGILGNDYRKILMKIIVLRPLTNDLRENLRELTHLLTQEKETVIQPFNKFLDEKRTVYHKMDELFEHNMGSLYDKVKHYLRGKKHDGARITKKDIQEDIKHFLKTYDEGAYQISDRDLKSHIATLSSSSEFREYADKLEEIDRLFRHSILTERAERFLNHMKALSRKGTFKSETKAKSALYDGLTLLKNRKAFNIELEKAIAIADRNAKQKFALIIIDIDNFKGVNEVYGHSAGDQVLVNFSEALQKNVRKSDTVFRWGGEEFTIILRDVDERAALGITEKLRRTIKGLENGPFALQPARVKVKDEWIAEKKLLVSSSSQGEDTIKITSSAGVTFYPQDATTATAFFGQNIPETMFKAADKAENYSKDHGKDCVTTFSDCS